MLTKSVPQGSFALAQKPRFPPPHKSLILRRGVSHDNAARKHQFVGNKGQFPRQVTYQGGPKNRLVLPLNESGAASADHRSRIYLTVH
jgi:hypothetical protein